MRFFESDAMDFFGYVMDTVQLGFVGGLEQYLNETNLLQEQIGKNGRSDVSMVVAAKKGGQIEFEKF